MKLFKTSKNRPTNVNNLPLIYAVKRLAAILAMERPKLNKVLKRLDEQLESDRLALEEKDSIDPNHNVLSVECSDTVLQNAEVVLRLNAMVNMTDAATNPPPTLPSHGMVMGMQRSLHNPMRNSEWLKVLLVFTYNTDVIKENPEDGIHSLFKLKTIVTTDGGDYVIHGKELERMLEENEDTLLTAAIIDVVSLLPAGLKDAKAQMPLYMKYGKRFLEDGYAQLAVKPYDEMLGDARQIEYELAEKYGSE